MKSNLTNTLLAALPLAGLLATAPVALAHEDWRYGRSYNDPAGEHEAYHGERDARHEDFHAMPHSRREHRRFHRQDKREHRALHRDFENEWRRGYSDRDYYGGRYSDRDRYRDRYSDDYYGRPW
jgi:hypothetical protein